ncbi:MAG: hypothetical protein WC007_04940 [Pelobacteraceae bacterium]
MFKRLILTLAGISLLAGCGGGSGDSGGSAASVPAAYTGSTNQATISTANAKTLSADAYAGSQFSSAVSIGKVAAQQSGRTALMQQTAGILENSVATIVGGNKSSAKVVASSTQQTINGYSGFMSFYINLDDVSGAFNGTLSFSQYKSTSDAISLSGTMDISGVFSRTANTFISMTMSNIRLTGTDAGESFTMSGSMTSSAGGTTKTETMSIVLSDNVSSRTFWMKDFTFTLTGNSLTITGTYYDHVYGYVVISTPTPLTVLSIDAEPTSGQLLFSGSNGTKARLTFTSGTPTVEADTSGTGTFVVIP